MFENISKGKFIASGNAVHVNEHECIHVSHVEARRENAEFIAYCFNLQQKYDISKIEEAVELLEKVEYNRRHGYDIPIWMLNEIEQLLK